MRASAISCRVVSAFMAIALAQGNAQVAKSQWRRVADEIRPKPPELAGFMDEGEDDVLVLRARRLGVREWT
jgi:putative transposase